METDRSDSQSCDRCGREALGWVGEELLCETCYHQSGSCCGEYGVKEECDAGD